MNKSLFVLLLIAIISTGLYSQSTNPVILKEGLVIKLRSNDVTQLISPNAIVTLMETGKWNAPHENQQIKSGMNLIGTWINIKADSTGWIKDDSLTNAYIYFAYKSDKDATALLEAMGNTMVYVNGSPHSGNPYRYQDSYEPGGPRFDYSFIPIKLHKGVNEFLFECNRGVLKVSIHPNQNGFVFIENDFTIPDLIVNEVNNMYGAIPIVNATDNFYKGLFVKTWSGNSQPAYYPVNEIIPLSITKIPFSIKLPAQTVVGNIPFTIALVKKENGKEDFLSSSIIELHVVNSGDTHKETFISNIDGSVQYYAVNPPDNLKSKPALFLSLHGAGVEAINQAQAYGHKNWGYVVAPTNRRPYGYNWENWGRMDALEVLKIAKEKFNVDESRVYLTGHSMGGHGTWQLGINYPDQFAAIGPSAGWISIWSYRIKPVHDSTLVGKMLTRSTKQSDTYAFTTNLKQNGIYIIQGDADDNVPPAQPESMIANLSKFHKDYIYHVQHGAGHWWDNSDEPGADCVDWAPMFDFFAHHSVAGKEKIKMIDFVTANPAISSKNYWVEIINQVEQQTLSNINIRLEQGNRKFIGTTNNIELLSIDVSMLSDNTPFSIVLDNQILPGISNPSDKIVYLLKENGTWKLSDKPSKENKNPARCGIFREAFNNRPIFVYGTNGNTEENIWAFEKARYDAERIWYRGNSSLEVIKDTDFDLPKYQDRSVILVGNSKTNSAWSLLLKDSPVQVDNNKIKVGAKEYKGGDYACIFIRPRQGSDNASVGAISGTSIEGMKLANIIPYFDQYLNFPDVVIYNSGILQSDEKGVVFTGYFGNDWSLGKGEFVSQ
jgi:dienelactone hydrolase